MTLQVKSKWPLGLAALIVAAYLVAWVSGYSLAVNTSVSMPRGLYVLAPVDAPQRGDVVSACISNLEAAKVYRERDYIGPSERCAAGMPPVMKPIVAVPGDTVEVTAMGTWVNGQLLPKSRVFDTDSDGRPIEHLPLGWKKTLAAGEFFILANIIERSLDSRYYGPVLRADIHGRVRPIFTI
jgi:conjugative transfer signal peptidase TraF